MRDGFHFWAFLPAPLWLLLHGLWLALVIYMVGYGIVIGGLGFSTLRRMYNSWSVC